MIKSLDAKLADIHARGSASKAFILADAKDADMAFGISSPGRDWDMAPNAYRTLEQYRRIIRENVQQGLVDIMLMSVSTSEAMTIQERLFENSPVTPAIRANDATDVHVARGSVYVRQPARPFRTALLDHALYGRLNVDGEAPRVGADLGLFSVTFNNDLDTDLPMLEAYKEFRIEAETKRFRHFLEVFPPNAPRNALAADQVGHFMNDMIARTLAGVASPARPIFLKVAYTGPAAMEQLAAYDPHLVPGVLGGSSGTTYDAFKLLADARKYGARAALFGRKINHAEHQLSFIQFLRWIADGEITPEEAVKAYHGVLAGLGIRPHRPLEEDRQLTDTALSYGGSAARVTVPAAAGTPSPRPGEAVVGKPPSGPDFAKMTSQQKLEYHRRRLAAL